MSNSIEDLVEGTRRSIAEVEATPEGTYWREEALEVLRANLADQELTAAEMRGDVEPRE